MLHLLKEYALKNNLMVEPGFAPKDVRWAISFDKSGKYLGVIELGDTSLKRNPGRTFFKCPNFSFSEMKAGGVKKSHFLVETAEVVALYGKKSEDAETQKKNKYFIFLLKKVATALPILKKTAEQLEQLDIRQQICEQMAESKVRPNDKVTIQIDNQFPVDSDEWHDWWRMFRTNIIPEKKKEKTSSLVRSLMTGQLIEPLQIHPKISKLSDVGGQATGDALISFKMDSFRSFDLPKSTNAAIGNEEAAVYSAAMNDLLKNHSQRLSKAKVVHWFKEKIPKEDDPLPWLEQFDGNDELNAQQQARELLESIKTGKRPDLKSNFYYALTLSGASGRVMVRDWMEGQFEELVQNICDWFDDLEIVHRDGNRLAPVPKFFAVLGAMVRDLKELPAPFIAKMWRVAVYKESIPTTAIAQVLHRLRSDIVSKEENVHPFNHAGMGLLKAYHVRNARKTGKEIYMKSHLNINHPEPAYHCGRLMAVLADVQRAALGEVGAGIIQRYYSAASTTPALILGNVTRISQHHLNKLQSDKPGLAHYLENKIAEVWNGISDTIPATLTLEEQSLFALGYYHQMADLRTKKSEKNENEKENSHE